MTGIGIELSGGAHDGERHALPIGTGDCECGTSCLPDVFRRVVLSEDLPDGSNTVTEYRACGRQSRDGYWIYGLVNDPTIIPD